MQGSLYSKTSKVLGLTVTVPAGFRSKEVAIKFEDKTFSKKIHFCGAYVTAHGDHLPCLDTQRIFSLPKFLKVFSQDAAAGVFADDAEVLEANPGNSSAGLYSVLRDLEEHRKPDGTFHLKLCYPGAS